MGSFAQKTFRPPLTSLLEEAAKVLQAKPERMVEILPSETYFEHVEARADELAVISKQGR